MSETEIETISLEQYDALMGKLDEVKKSMDESKERDEEILKAYEAVGEKLEEFEKAYSEENRRSYCRRNSYGNVQRRRHSQGKT